MSTHVSKAIRDLTLACACCNGPLNSCDCWYTEDGLPDCAKGFFYRTRDTGDNSNRCGCCEICDKPCSSVYTQVEFRFYLDPETKKLAITYADCRTTTFGHKECLERIQRKGGAA